MKMVKHVLYCLFFIAFIMADAITPHTNRGDLHLQLLAQIETASEDLGYDPHAQLRFEAPSDQIVLYFHGYGGRGKDAEKIVPLKNVPLLTFDFQDAASRSWRATSLGQKKEVLVAAYFAHACVKAGFKKILLFGFSRGGAVALNLLRLLKDQAYEKDLDSVGISKLDAEKIVVALETGGIMLQAPLVDSFKAIGKSIGGLGTLFGFRHIAAFLFSCVTRHALFGMQGVHSVKWLCDVGHRFRIVWHIKTNDTVVPSDEMYQCIRMLEAYDNKRIYVSESSGNHLDHPSDQFIDHCLNLLV